MNAQIYYRFTPQADPQQPGEALTTPVRVWK